MSEPEVRIWEERPVRGSFGDPSSLDLPGVDRMKVRGGKFVPPPMYHLTGLEPVEASFGSTAFRLPLSPWLQSPVPHLIPAGVVAFLADGPLGTAIMTALPARSYMTTWDISMSFLQPATLGSGSLIGRARLIHGGRSVALSEVNVEDEQGRLIAYGTSRGFLLTWKGDLPPGRESDADREYDTPDPHLRRPVAGSSVPLEVWERTSGLEVLLACIRGEHKPPLYHLTGLRPTEASEGRCTFVLPASTWMAAPSPVMYGGSIAFLADAALSGAVMTICPPGGSFGPLDLKVNYLRPVPMDGGLLTARATLEHRGRSMVMATAELVSSDNKRVALASSTAMLLPGRPWGEAGATDLARSDQPGDENPLNL